MALVAGSTSGLSISLHPLVIINISDHATRKKMQNQGQQQRVLGVLLGVQVWIAQMRKHGVVMIDAGPAICQTN